MTGKDVLLGVVIGIALAVLARCASAQQIMEPTKLDAIRAALPDLEDEERHAQLHSDEAVWYDTRSMPPAYQHQMGNGHGHTAIHSPYYNISADPSDSGLPHGKGGNANVEFPWNIAPGGAHRAPHVLSAKAFILRKPVAIYQQDRRGRVGTQNISRVWDWVFPNGTTFIEILTMRMSDGLDHVFEIRFRTKEGSDWAVDIFRPFATAEDLAKALEGMGHTERRAAAIADLRKEETLPVMRLADDRHTRKLAFERTESVYNLPLIAGKDIYDLLDRPFVSCLGETFKGKAMAPSNNTQYANLVPPNYHGAFVGNDRISCMENCHGSALHHATEFEDRGWYGRVRGNSDRILSWHPFDPSCISYSGKHLQVTLRREFVEAGIIENYDRAKHTAQDYPMLKVD